MHRKTTENAVFTRNFEFIDPLRSFDRNMVFNYTNLTIRKGLLNLLHYFVIAVPLSFRAAPAPL